MSRDRKLSCSSRSSVCPRSLPVASSSASTTSSFCLRASRRTHVIFSANFRCVQLEDLSEILGSEPLVCVELYRCLAHANVSEHQPTIGEGGREELGGRGWDEKGQGKRASLGKERVPFHASHRLERETLSLSLFFFSSSFSCFFPLFSFRVPFHASHRLTTFGITCL